MRSAPFSGVEHHHVGVLGVDLVEPISDQAMVVEVEPTGKRDLRSRRQHYLGFSATPGGEEVAAVDHRGGQGAMVDQ